MGLNEGNKTNYHNMFSEISGNTNLRNLSNLQDINNISHKANGIIQGFDSDTKRERFIEFFYDKMLLDTIKLGSENNVFVKYCQTKEVPQGNEKFLLRRWGGLTEHTHPLAEGIPPKSDRVASESFTGTYCSYGRYMEFTDRVDYMLIDPIVAHYSAELGDVAVRMAERLCRNEFINNAAEIYANGKTFATLTIGDTVGIADYRAQALKFKRILVLPLSNGSYNVIASPEHIYDLVEDPLVDTYMRYTQTAEPYISGKPVDLFNIRFEETMLDDYAYGYTEISNPGEFLVGSDPYIRLVLVKKTDNSIVYMNVKGGANNTATLTNGVAVQSGTYLLDDTLMTCKRTVAEGTMRDGSYIPEIVTWDIDGFKKALVDGTVQSKTIAVTKADSDGKTVADTIATDAFGSVSNNKYTFNYDVYQLPVHRSFMFGKEFMVKTGMSGRMNAKFYVKPLGSSGVLDPIDQRQSVGFKIDTLGFNTLRAEAMVQFIFVPTQALTTYIASDNSWKTRYPSSAANGTQNVFQPGKSTTYADATVSTHQTEGPSDFTDF